MDRCEPSHFELYHRVLLRCKYRCKFLLLLLYKTVGQNYCESNLNNLYYILYIINLLIVIGTGSEDLTRGARSTRRAIVLPFW